jgi:hypothetical protein
MDNLFKLSGMCFCNGYYTPEEWITKTGTDPRRYPNYIRIDTIGKCVWTEKAERAYKSHRETVWHNWHVLGIAN